MTTFRFPLPSHITKSTATDRRVFPDSQTVEKIKMVWGGRAPLPAGGFDALVTVPELTDNTRDGMHEPVALYVYHSLRAAGVLNTPPAVLGVRFQAGDVTRPEVLVTMGQLLYPDGSPVVWPKEAAPYAAS